MKEKPTNIKFVQTSLNKATYKRLADKCLKIKLPINEAQSNVEAMNNGEECEEYKGSKLAQYNYLRARLEQLEKEMIDKEISAWLIPKCPNCDGVLSLYTFTQKLVCLKCGSIWALGWCSRERAPIYEHSQIS